MRVLYIFRSLAVYGGIERSLVNKMNYLVRFSGMEVYLITSDQGSHPIPYEMSSDVHMEDLGIMFHHQYRYNGLRRWIIHRKMRNKYQRLMANRLRTIQPDLMICTTADKIDILIKVKGVIPLVVESHSICVRTIEKGNNWLYKTIYRHQFLRSLIKAEVLVALTEGDAQEWRRYHNNVVVIPNYINLHRTGISMQLSKSVMFVGRFDYQKCVQEAILIWKIVHKHYPDWTLEIYGEGEMQEEIESLAHSVGGVHIHRPTNQIFKCYQQSCILILTSLFEPFGLVIPEAMSCGLPVVAFDCPYGPSSILTDGSDGFLISNRDQQAFAEAVCNLIENKDMRVSMGQAGYIASQKYNEVSVMLIWQQLFEQIIKYKYI